MTIVTVRSFINEYNIIPSFLITVQTDQIFLFDALHYMERFRRLGKNEACQQNAFTNAAGQSRRTKMNPEMPGNIP